VVTPLVTLPNGTPFMAALKPRIRVADEARVKENETVVMRPWVSAVVVWARGPTYGGDRFLLVAEFRSSVNNRVGTVIEVPGGSSTDARADRAPRTVRGSGPARRRERLVHLGDYQPAPTVSTHGIHAYAAEIPAANMDTLAARECKCGNPGETEITYPRVYTRAEICADRGRRFGTDVLGLISLTNREAVGLNTSG